MNFTIASAGDPEGRSQMAFRIGLVLALFSGVPSAARAADDSGDIVAVSSRVSDDYIRKKLPDGSYRPESYAFGSGGFRGGALSDRTIDNLGFTQIAHTIAGPLPQKQYVPTKDPADTRLLIMVYWGTTRPPEKQRHSAAFQAVLSAKQELDLAKAGGNGAMIASAGNAFFTAMGIVQMEEERRERLDADNAAMLGYDSWWGDTSQLKNTVFDGRRNDMIEELEEDRYFVVLMAYDFQLLWKEKKHKLLWETRFSIRERHNDFDKQLAAMSSAASRYFGQESKGLRHKPAPEGQVEAGELKVIGYDSGKK
ncbi:MAG TPA: hypothetical protein VGM73_03855 [Candidatus Didemnitutus sp.]|jgi:hypothetical protein